MQARALLAGGCFWGMQDLLRRLPGVIETQVGYTGGHTENPIYDTVKTGSTGHAEAMEILFDDARLSYEQLLRFFFQIHDPTTLNRQGNDCGSQYRSAIFYVDDGQKQTAEALIGRLDESGKWPGKIVTEITPAGTFYPAEAYHQDYLQKYPDGYTCHFIRPGWEIYES